MSAPSLLKKWQDEVFTYLAKTPAVSKALQALVAVTTGSNTAHIVAAEELYDR